MTNTTPTKFKKYTSCRKYYLGYPKSSLKNPRVNFWLFRKIFRFNDHFAKSIS